jgi:putative CocE/NonD family hydrolase
MIALRRGIAVLSVLLAAGTAFPQGLDYVRKHYTKHEHYVPMRDGVRLFTSVYLPKDRSSHPIMLIRTPYSLNPYGSDRYPENLGPSPLFGKEGYIFAYQDVRGRWMSEGQFENMRPHLTSKTGTKEIDESTDTYDTIEWLLKNVRGHNGRVGMWGISYPGFYVAAGIIDSHPALKAASPQAPVADWFGGDDWHHNGAFLLAHAFGWFSAAGWPFTKPTTKYPGPTLDARLDDGYEFYRRLGPVRNANERYFKNEVPFWNEMMKREARDAWWNARNIRPHLRNIRTAVMTVGGWFDAENLFGALEVYRAIETQNPGIFNMLVMGPWIHGGWARNTGDSLGDIRFDANTAEFYREQIELPFFNHYLKDTKKAELPEAWVFETGTNEWRKYAAWPPKSISRELYLRRDGRLSFEAPPSTPSTEEFDEYISDPAKPVPFMSGIASGMAPRYMVDDQRFAARRPDVLAYQTDILEEDITVAGPIMPSLNVSTTGTDSDWIVKLIDVYPDRFPDAKGSTDNTLGGYQQLVRGDVLRGKFRNSLEKPEPFVPGQATKVEFAIPDTLHTFRRGHRIMVQIQSTWFPLINVNPQKFLNINEASEGDFQRATQRVYRSPGRPSSIRIGTIPR